jgi:hypothetical protein
MTHSRYLASTLMLVLSTAACDVADSLGPDTLGGNGGDAIEAVLASVNSADPNRGGGSNGSLFDRLASEIPGFGGLYRTGECAVAVVLTDLSRADHAIRTVKAALEPLRGCPNGIRVSAVRGQFTYLELQRFFDAANRELLQIDGVISVKVDYQKNKLVVAIRAREIAAKVMEGAARLGIPADAIALDVVDGSGRTPSGATPVPSRGR